MCNLRLKIVFVLFVFYEAQLGSGFPQFFKGFTAPKLASWDNNKKTLTLPLNIKIESPVKTLNNIFGIPNRENQNVVNSVQEQGPVKGFEQNTVEKKKENLIKLPNDNGQKNGQESFDVNNKITPQNQDAIVFKEDENFPVWAQPSPTSFPSRFAEITTESITETTPYDIETTTIEDDLFNRASPQLVASLLG